MVKFFLPNIERRSPARIYILEQGIDTNENATFCNDPNEADYILIEGACQHFVIENPQFYSKSIMIDFRDNPKDVFPNSEKYFLYFKRSIVNPNTMHLYRYSTNIVPIIYPIKNHDLINIEKTKQPREIDIAVFFNNQYKYRGSVVDYVKRNFSEYNIQLGPVGSIGNTGRRNKQELYYEVMANTKIVVNCNPDHWFGDWRLFETFSSGAMVMADKMPLPVKKPFIDGTHLVYYDRNNLDTLGEKLRYYLNNKVEMEEISTNGWKYCMNNHTASHRIDEIIEECYKKKNNE